MLQSLELKLKLDELSKKLSEALQKIEELKRRLGLNSNNSSKPPSSDGLKKQTFSLTEKGLKRAGEQEGHKGHTLKMVESPDKIINHVVTFCAKCSADLTNRQNLCVTKRQVFDLPETK